MNLVKPVIGESSRQMKQEVIDARQLMLLEHPEIFNVSESARGKSAKTELGKVNFATWMGASWSERPSYDCMRRLLDELGMSSTGTRDVVRRRFKKNVSRDDGNG
jgi:hypothetical protein